MSPGFSERFLSPGIVWIWVAAFRAVCMREEFASRSFLAVTVLGVALLCSGLVTLALG
jgi:hypothetical protein